MINEKGGEDLVSLNRPNTIGCNAFGYSCRGVGGGF